MKITQDLADEAFKHRYRTLDYYDMHDIERICNVLNVAHGISISVSDAADFWRWRSDLMCAGWLMIFDDDEIIDSFNKFIRCACAHE